MVREVGKGVALGVDCEVTHLQGDEQDKHANRAERASSAAASSQQSSEQCRPMLRQHHAVQTVHQMVGHAIRSGRLLTAAQQATVAPGHRSHT